MEKIPFCSHNHMEIKEIEEVIEHHDESNLERLSEFFKAFADPTRLRIIHALSREEMCVCCLAECVGMSQSAVSHQLRYLRGINIVKCRRDGKSIIYSLTDAHIVHIYGEGVIHIMEN